MSNTNIGLASSALRFLPHRIEPGTVEGVCCYSLFSMARVSTYLNFPRQTEEAFNFYKSVFGTEFVGEISRFASVPQQPGAPEMKEEDKNLVMHVASRF